ncbi:hypothetical protein CH352_05370 [Leptospira hartskeerlii]|uniref:Uncharacterized protein n=1 Tax=Leptospira hartskeerlii TaxID=2023177 RepID=A0A2M9XFN6_9LEPT|nr:hypothetical protein [Leptospira hartskeerlii]PJZ26496.1 hypothetical protein CH357_03085 [Leptospira hartskeerlii]PJZ35021.1 hypothetical protein CH352_05370 [Leptospira hartskeerlii]
MASLIEEPEFPKLISAYRAALRRRYSRDNLSKYPKFSSIPEEKVDLLVRYFLELLYPEYEGRKKLDGAFESLAGFVHSPPKVFGLLGSLSMAVFKLGRHLKSAFQAGFAALHSYVTAHRFEEIMFSKAKELLKEGKDLQNKSIFNQVLASVSKKDADEFREDILKLFATLSDKDLLSKIKQLMDAVIQTMKSKPKTYTPQEIEGIMLGAGILTKGEELFAGMTKGEMDLILEAIDQVEKDSFEEAIASVRGK